GPDHGGALSGLLPEICAIGLHDLKELHHHRRHPAEVAGTELPAQMCGNTPNLDDAGRLRRVHVRDAGREHDVHLERFADIEVGLQRAGVPVEIFLAIELHRVDEDADDHAIAFAAP